MLQQVPYDRLGRHPPHRRRVEQLARQPGPGGPPGREAEQAHTVLGRFRARAPLPRRRVDQRAGERGQDDRGGGVQADVGDPELDRRIPLGEPDVEVDHPVVQDRPGGEHVRDPAVVALGRAEQLRGTGRRPALPDPAAVAAVRGVPALPERRVRAQRGQHRQPGPHPVDHRDALLVGVDGDVHVTPQDQLLVDHDAVLLGHPLVAPVHADGGRHRQR